MNQLTEMMITLITLVCGVALVSVLVSKNANTAGVTQSFFSGFGNTLGVAEAPVTGASYTPVLSYPSATGSNFGS